MPHCITSRWVRKNKHHNYLKCTFSAANRHISCFWLGNIYMYVKVMQFAWIQMLYGQIQRQQLSWLSKNMLILERKWLSGLDLAGFNTKSPSPTKHAKDIHVNNNCSSCTSQRVPHAGQKMLTLPEHQISHILVGVCVNQMAIVQWRLSILNPELVTLSNGFCL